MPRKYAFPTLEKQAFHASTRLILNFVNNMIKYIDMLYEVDLKFAIANSILHGQEIKQYFNLMIPPSIQNDISIFCLKTKHKHYDVKHLDNMYKRLLQIIAETIFSARTMKVMSLVNIPQNVKSLFLRHLPCMCQLNVLQLPYYSSEKPSVMKLLNEGLVSMPHLEEFMFSECSDSIIEKIAFHCKKIQKIDITYSRVTNASIPALCMCEHLKEFQFYGSYITSWGYENLLINHPRLETVDLTASLDLRSQEIVNSSLLRFEPSILYKWDKTLKKDNLRKLSSMHPHIITLRISLYNDNQLSILLLFPNVQNVIIESYTCKKCFDNLHDTLKLIGSKIKSLHFIGITIDLKTFFIINKYCPNIIDLKINRLHFDVESTLIEQLLFMKCKSFYSLIEIHVTSYYQIAKITVARRQFFIFLLSYCTNIQSIFIDGFDLDDEMMKQVILSNPLKQLETLTIQGKTHLTMNSVDLLMEHCDNLWHLQKLEHWDIDSGDLDRFRKYLKSDNINVIT